ncbi:hypothetical protein [Limisphaera sp. VF-2]|jgi:hypothetical protein|uniref:hypothetical protein n=1 Tax=Limisphaera sp. VF-2 TaxID=3400418 RepID=UPI003C1B1EE3
MKNQPPESNWKRFFGLRPAIAVEAFIIVLVVCLLLFGKFGTWLLNAVKNLVGQ